jgi:flagellar hook assembly protein FlgD
MVGIGQDIYPPWNYRSFIIRMDNPMPVADPADLVLAMPSMQAFPNPTSGATTLMLELPQPAEISLEIHDITGRLVRTLSGGSIQAGRHQVRWDGMDASGTEVPSGAYYCRFTAGTQEGLQKITIMR